MLTVSKLRQTPILNEFAYNMQLLIHLLNAFLYKCLSSGPELRTHMSIEGQYFYLLYFSET